MRQYHTVPQSECTSTERSIRALPAEIQKDIGWPHAYRSNTVNKVVTGGWN